MARNKMHAYFRNCPTSLLYKQHFLAQTAQDTHVLIPILRHFIQFHCRINFFAIRLAHRIYFFSATVRFFSGEAAKQWLAVYSQGILMILSPYLLKFTIQQSSDWHMVVSRENTVRLGSRSMLTLWRHLWKELIESDLCIPSQYGFSLDVVLFPHRESKVLSSRSAHRSWWTLYRLWASLGRDLGCLRAAVACSSGAMASGQGTGVPSRGVTVFKRGFECVGNGSVEGEGLGFEFVNKFLGKINSSFNQVVKVEPWFNLNSGPLGGLDLQ